MSSSPELSLGRAQWLGAGDLLKPAASFPPGWGRGKPGWGRGGEGAGPQATCLASPDLFQAFRPLIFLGAALSTGKPKISLQGGSCFPSLPRLRLRHLGEPGIRHPNCGRPPHPPTLRALPGCLDVAGMTKGAGQQAAQPGVRWASGGRREGVGRASGGHRVGIGRALGGQCHGTDPFLYKPQTPARVFSNPSSYVFWTKRVGAIHSLKKKTAFVS